MKLKGEAGENDRQGDRSEAGGTHTKSQKTEHEHVCREEHHSENPGPRQDRVAGDAQHHRINRRPVGDCSAEGRLGRGVVLPSGTVIPWPLARLRPQTIHDRVTEAYEEAPAIGNRESDSRDDSDHCQPEERGNGQTLVDLITLLLIYTCADEAVATACMVSSPAQLHLDTIRLGRGYSEPGLRSLYVGSPPKRPPMLWPSDVGNLHIFNASSCTRYVSDS